MSGPSHGDVVFAQKASACVKAAGLDPKAIDLKSFRKLVPVILTRAYENIYKEDLEGLIEEPITDRDHGQNVQLVIDQLAWKTRNEALVRVTGADIVSGDDFSIGVVVGVIYSEGHRMWLEKVGQRTPGITLADVKPRSRPSSGKKDKRSSSKKKTRLKQRQDAKSGRNNDSDMTLAILDEAIQADFESDYNKAIEGPEEEGDNIAEEGPYEPLSFTIAPPKDGKHSQNSPIRQKRIIEKERRKNTDKSEVESKFIDWAGEKMVSLVTDSDDVPVENEAVDDNGNDNGVKVKEAGADGNGFNDDVIERNGVYDNKGDPHAGTYPTTTAKTLANLRKGSVGRNINEVRHEFNHPHFDSDHAATEPSYSQQRRTRPTSAPAAGSGSSQTKKRPLSAAKTRIHAARTAHDELFDRLYNTGTKRDVIAARMELERAAANSAYEMEEARRKFEFERAFSPLNRKSPSNFNSNPSADGKNDVVSGDGDVGKERDKSSEMNVTYTYDLLTGRKIPLSQAELIALERRKKLEQYLNVKDVSELNDDPTGAGDSNSKPKKKSKAAGAGAAAETTNYIPVSTQAEWPTKMTETSVEKWMERMRVSRGELPEEAPPVPKFYSAYNRLKGLDLIISIEHCHKCEHHNMTLRHDAAEYVRNSDFMLRSLAQVAHECAVCVRVGVIRTCARITSKSKTSDADSRIGAFEVQVALRSSTGEISCELLHSKLLSRKWPSKTVLDKRMRVWLAKCELPTHYNMLDFAGNSVAYATDGLETYPVGVVSWLETPLAHPDWSFPTNSIVQGNSVPSSPIKATMSKGVSSQKLLPPPAAAAAGAKKSTAMNPPKAGSEKSNSLQTVRSLDKEMKGVADQSQGTGTGGGGGGDGDEEANEDHERKLNVVWVFDARGEAQKPKFPNGTVVIVTNTVTPKGAAERSGLLGVVRGFQQSKDSSTRNLIVHLKYYDRVIAQGKDDAGPEVGCLVVPPVNCDAWDVEWKSVPAVPAGAGRLPSPLEALFVYLRRADFRDLVWRSEEPEDCVNKYGHATNLSRPSFFRQARNLVAEVEARVLLSLSDVDGGAGEASSHYSQQQIHHNSSSKKSQEYQSALIPHPFSGENIDLQLCYSEATLDWIFKRYKGSADLLTMNLAVIKAEEEFEKRAEEKFKEAMELADKLAAEEAAVGASAVEKEGVAPVEVVIEEEDDEATKQQLKAEAEALAEMNATAAENLATALIEGSKTLKLLTRIKGVAGKHVTLVLRTLGIAKKGGDPSLEAVLCCKLLRTILRDLMDVDASGVASQRTAGTGNGDTAPVAHVAFVSLFSTTTGTLSRSTLLPYIQPIFTALDRRGMDALSWADLNEVLVAIGIGKCSDEAFRLVMLSIDTDGDGDISLEELTSFIIQFDIDEPPDDLELGAIWSTLRSQLVGDDAEGHVVDPETVQDTRKLDELAKILDKKVQEQSLVAAKTNRTTSAATGDSTQGPQPQSQSQALAVSYSTCSREDFFKALDEVHVRSFLSDAESTLLLSAFAVTTLTGAQSIEKQAAGFTSSYLQMPQAATTRIRALDFVKWLQADSAPLGCRSNPAAAATVSLALFRKKSSLRVPPLSTNLIILPPQQQDQGMRGSSRSTGTGGTVTARGAPAAVVEAASTSVSEVSSQPLSHPHPTVAVATASKVQQNTSEKAVKKDADAVQQSIAVAVADNVKKKSPASGAGKEMPTSGHNNNEEKKPPVTLAPLPVLSPRTVPAAAAAVTVSLEKQQQQQVAATPTAESIVVSSAKTSARKNDSPSTSTPVKQVKAEETVVVQSIDPPVKLQPHVVPQTTVSADDKGSLHLHVPLDNITTTGVAETGDGAGTDSAAIDTSKTSAPPIAAKPTVFEGRDLLFNSITVSGRPLKHPQLYDIKIDVIIGDETYSTSAGTAKDRGTDKRAFSVAWGYISISPEMFENSSATIVLHGERHGSLTPHTTIDPAPPSSSEENVLLQEQPSETLRVQVPLYAFMVEKDQAFDVPLHLLDPRSTGSSNDNQSGVEVLLHGTARENSVDRGNRIRRMSIDHLKAITFEPLEVDDEEEDDVDDGNDIGNDDDILDSLFQSDKKKPEAAKLKRTLSPSKLSGSALIASMLGSADADESLDAFSPPSLNPRRSSTNSSAALRMLEDAGTKLASNKQSVDHNRRRSTSYSPSAGAAGAAATSASGLVPPPRQASFRRKGDQGSSRNLLATTPEKEAAPRATDTSAATASPAEPATSSGTLAINYNGDVTDTITNTGSSNLEKLPVPAGASTHSSVELDDTDYDIDISEED